MRWLVFGLLWTAPAFADVSVEADRPGSWATACKRDLLAARDRWNLDHPTDPLPAPFVYVMKKDGGRMNFPRITIYQYFFQGSGKGQAQISWREPWSAPLSGKFWPNERTIWFGGLSRGLVRGESPTQPYDDWYPPGSRVGSFSVGGDREHWRELVEKFWPAVEACVRR